MSLQEPLTETSARFAFLFILGREPEDAAILQYALSFGTVRKLREALLNSLEFEPVLHRRPRVVRADAPPLTIEWQGAAPAMDTKSRLVRFFLGFSDKDFSVNTGHFLTHGDYDKNKWCKDCIPQEKRK